MKKYNILTTKEYSEIDYRMIPYFFRVAAKKKTIFYLGVSHTYDPWHIQFEEITKKWQEFIEYSSENKLVLVESSLRPYYEDLNEAITRDSAAGFITHHAKDANIEVNCVEPTKEMELELLYKKYSKENVAYYHFSRIVAQFLKKNRNKENLSIKMLEKYIRPYLRSYAKYFGWKNFKQALSDMYDVHKELFGKEFSLEDKTFLIKIPWPTLKNSLINEISEESGIIRDNWIVGEIEKLWNDEKSLFIVYGSSHALIQERALKSFEGAID